MKKYKNDYINKIAFPLGGIGTGSISISGNGGFVDAEINNRPNRGKCCRHSGFAVRAEKDGKIVDARMLCGDNDNYDIGNFYAAFRHFDDVSFEEEFPFAKVNLADSVFPGTAVIEAFNPMIPSNDKDSSIPAAFFNITLTNTSKEKMTYSIWQNMSNLLEDNGFNKYFEANKIKGVTIRSEERDENSVKYGNISIATDAEHTSHTEYWYTKTWFDTTTMFKNDLLTPGDLKNRSYDKASHATTTLAAQADIEPGESKTFRFLISWYVPNAECYWIKDENPPCEGNRYKNYYSQIFKDSEDVVGYCFDNWDRLYTQSKLFAKNLASSSLPEEVKDAISGNLAILKSTTCLRLEDGSFWGWEGVWQEKGSCEGTCQHVYNYAYATAFLFPQLEKGIRTNEINCSLEEDGKMNFRMSIGLKDSHSWRACVDGQMGFVIKCYREWKLSGDSEWLKNNWKSIKNALEFTWSDTNPDRWDPQKTGVITGRQHHTLDVELFGVYSWLTGMYHAALFAASEMAEYLGDVQTAEEYLRIAKQGQKILDEKTFNGEYYVQLLDLNDKQTVSDLTHNVQYSALNDGGDCDTEYYLDDETNQAKYQIENGCEIDQVLADWHADIIGLPQVFNREHREKALKSIYKYNYMSMHDNLNSCRNFACNDEKGVLICTWPENVRKPVFPIPYADECMTGFEYAFAANMLQCGMEDKALEIVRSIRERYDGKRRNPFAEIECGASYARAMASYSFLLIYSGFKFDMPNKALGFKPLKNGSFFWSVDGAWGMAEFTDSAWKFSVDYGTLTLEHFITALDSVKDVSINGNSVPFEFKDSLINAKLFFNAGDTMTITVG